MTPERLARAKALLDDGASQMEVVRTTGLARETLIKYLPRMAWTYAEAARFGQEVRKAKRLGLL